MNIENVAQLTSIMSAAGFENLSFRLLQYICCKPVRFILSESAVRQHARVTSLLYFERKGGSDYSFLYYDASLIREQAMPAITINQIDLRELDLRMEQIDWWLSAPKTVFRLNDGLTWEREKNIEQVVNDLLRLSVTEDGKSYADILKVKHWSGKTMEDMAGGLAAIRSKLEVSQRFYVVDGECINTDEAFRFLQNRWTERRLQAERRHTPAERDIPTEGGNSKKNPKKKPVTRARKIG